VVAGTKFARVYEMCEHAGVLQAVQHAVCAHPSTTVPVTAQCAGNVQHIKGSWEPHHYLLRVSTRHQNHIGNQQHSSWSATGTINLTGPHA
jgi:hypothetical protein